MAPTGFFNNLAGLPWSETPLPQQEVTWTQANTQLELARGAELRHGRVTMLAALHA